MKTRGVRILLLAISTLGALTARAAPVVPCAEFNELWSNHFVPEMHLQWQTTPAPCSRTTREEKRDFKVALALYTLYKASLLPGAPDFYGYAQRGFRKIFVNENDFRGIAGTDPGGRITLMAQYFDDHVTDEVYRTIAFYHEARHTDRADPDHTICTRGADRGSHDCDASLLDDPLQGSGYNYDILYLSWLLHHASSLPWVDTGKVRSAIKNKFANRFNVPPSPEQRRRWLGD
jgi:hypothetical protein